MADSTLHLTVLLHYGNAINWKKLHPDQSQTFTCSLPQVLIYVEANGNKVLGASLDFASDTMAVSASVSDFYAQKQKAEIEKANGSFRSLSGAALIAAWTTEILAEARVIAAGLKQ